MDRGAMPTVGMIGGGQLARMTHQAAIALGGSLRVLATSPQDSAALVVADVRLGSPDDLAALLSFADGCAAVTFDHEHVPTEHVRALAAAGVTVLPGADALQYAQDKALMRTRLAELGVPVPAFAVQRAAELAAAVPAFAAEHGWPVVLKTARGGYDGRGVWLVDGPTGPDPDGSPAAVPAVPAVPELPPDTVTVLEAYAPLQRELAAVVARSPFGQAAAWPVVQTVQQDGICVEVIAPAPELPAATADAAEALALRIAAELGVVGVLAVELFQVPAGPAAPDGLLVNELAMRPHNSAHWTIEGAVTSQFEQHLRAVLDYPLGRTETVAPYAVMANVLGGPDDPGRPSLDERLHHLGARFPQVKVHLYGKQPRPGRKLGHVTVLGDDLPALRRQARLAARWLGDGVWPDGYSVHDGLTGADRAASRLTFRMGAR